MVSADAPCALRCRFVRMGLRGVMRLWRIPMNGGRWVRQPPKAGKWRTSGTQRLLSRRIPARYAALCVPGYGRVPSLCDERVQTEG
uniref:hypothetical protein n=1 Tax=Candidatus Limisoma sp. TaxID=3076476 RepID=UPI004028B703